MSVAVMSVLILGMLTAFTVAYLVLKSEFAKQADGNDPHG